MDKTFSIVPSDAVGGGGDGKGGDSEGGMLALKIIMLFVIIGSLATIAWICFQTIKNRTSFMQVTEKATEELQTDTRIRGVQFKIKPSQHYASTAVLNNSDSGEMLALKPGLSRDFLNNSRSDDLHQTHRPHSKAGSSINIPINNNRHI